MARGELDRDDLIWAPLFLLGSLYETGLVDYEIGSFNPTDILITVGSADVSYAAAASMVALAAVFLQRDEPLDTLNGVLEVWVVIITVGLVFLQPFIAPLDATIQNEHVVGLIAMILQVTGLTLIIYKN